MGRYLVEAHLREGRSVAELAAAHGVHPSWIYRLLARYRAEGDAGLIPRSRRPKRSPNALSHSLENEIVLLRKQLSEDGLDAGAQTIHWHLTRRHPTVPSVSSIMRVLRRRGCITPQPKKRPKSSYIRFEAELPNECWQSDMTHWTLTEALGITYKHSSPYHPQTCGKVERFHQTLKKYLTKQDAATTLPELQTQLDRFVTSYNEQRPHRALGRRTPQEAFDARLKAHPPATTPTTHFRVRHDKVDKHGSLTIRYDSKLHHIGMGARHRGQQVVMLIADRDIRIVTPDGELLRHLTLDPTRDYQPQTAGWSLR